MGNEQSAQKKHPQTNVEKKVQNGELNGHAVPDTETPDITEPETAVKAVVEQKSESPPAAVADEPKPPEKEEVDSSKPEPAPVEPTPEQKPTAEPPKKSKAEMSSFFGKAFKKKTETAKPAPEKKDAVDAPFTDADLKTEVQPDPVDIKSISEPEPEPKPEAEVLEACPVDVPEENTPSEEAKAAEKTVMNFFKTFVTPAKTSKEAKATPDASKEQSQKETPPAPPTNVQEAPKAPPPPPPPAPPKMESKAEAAVKKEETPAVKAEGSAKSKSKDGTLSKLFRSKVLLGKMVSKVQAATSSGGRVKTSGAPVVVEEKKPVEVQVDSSKTSTLEASAKPEEPPAPKAEEKKQEKKSTFGGMFKPKPKAAEAKKETAAPAPVAESALAVKAKDEPRAAPSGPQPAPDNRSTGSTDASPNLPRKLEKRNSLQLFFKNLVK